MNQAEADMIILFILLLAVFQVTVSSYLIENPDYYQLDAYTWETDDFRERRPRGNRSLTSICSRR